MFRAARRDHPRGCVAPHTLILCAEEAGHSAHRGQIAAYLPTAGGDPIQPRGAAGVHTFGRI